MWCAQSKTQGQLNNNNNNNNNNNFTFNYKHSTDSGFDPDYCQ